LKNHEHFPFKQRVGSFERSETLNALTWKSVVRRIFHFKQKAVNMYVVYILRNEKGRHYIGETNDLEKRLTQHNSNNKHVTGHNGNWQLVISSLCDSATEACQ